ncbi:MAG: hypothetical protein AB1500_07430 [Bacillota bacterium]
MMGQQRIMVAVFGENAPVSPGCGSDTPGCRPVKTMRDEVEELSRALKDKFGDRVAVEFIDVNCGEINNHPKIKEIVNRLKLPITAINGEPRFCGGIALKTIAEAIEGLFAV